MKKPVAGWRSFQINLQVQRFTGLLAARMNLPRAMHGRRYAERVPGAISEILGVIDDYDMLGRHAGKRRSHPNGHSIGFQYQHTLSAQSNIGFANAARVGANTFSYNFQRRPLPGLGEVLINRQFRLRIKAHALSEVNREWSTFPVINIGADRGVTSDNSCYDRGKMKELVTFVAIIFAFVSATRAQKASPTASASEATVVIAQNPNGYEICENEPAHRPVAGLEKREEHEKTISPSGRLAVLCPLRDEKSEHYPPNLLVRLKPYAVLAKLNKEGVPSNASLKLNATWQGGFDRCDLGVLPMGTGRSHHL